MSIRHQLSIPGFCLFLLFPLCSLADSILVQIDHSEPWGYYQTRADKEAPYKQLSGIWIDILQLFSEQTDLRFRTTLAPYARVIQNLESGKVDMSFLVRPDQDNNQLLYVAELFPISTIVVTTSQSGIASYEDLAGKRIGIVRGARITNRFDQDAAIFKRQFRSFEIIVTMLFQNRLDAVVGDDVSIYFLMKKKGFRDIHCHSFLLKRSSVWLQFSAHSVHQPKIQQLLVANDYFRKTGRYQKILDQYLGE